MSKSIIIIGAGIGGLSAGCYAQMNGYRSHIFEMHDQPGGLCTAWQRNGYTIDGCLHWLMGSAPDKALYPIWLELGALQGQQIINLEQLIRFEGADGKHFTFYSDIDRLVEHMLELAPEDAQFIGELDRALRHLTHFNLPVDKAPELYYPFDGVKMMSRMAPFLGEVKKWGGMTMRQLASHFKNPLLREAWELVWHPDFAALFILMTLVWMHQKTAGYIIGGSMNLSRAVEKRYLGLGGEVHYQSRVEKILVEDDRAVGVRLADSSEHRADYVISAADGYATIFDMLEGRYINDKIRGYYDNLPIFQPLIYIGLGVNRSFQDFPQIISGLVVPLEKPVLIAGEERKWLSVRIHNFDPTLAPPGKTLITVMFESNYPYWESLRRDISCYQAEKEQIAAKVVARLDKRFPGLTSQIEMRDVATPLTFRRYTGNWQGSFEGWLMTPRTLNLNMSKTLPGLAAFFMVGQWVMPGGGLPSGAMSGRWVLQLICKRDKKRFTASVL